jgi:hypothetical protein
MGKENVQISGRERRKKYRKKIESQQRFGTPSSAEILFGFLSRLSRNFRAFRDRKLNDLSWPFRQLPLPIP